MCESKAYAMRLPVGDPARAWLRPAGSDAADAMRLTEWRNRFVRAFLTEFEATEERTAHWLKESVAPEATKVCPSTWADPEKYPET